jgi:hypothetical protein
MRQRYEPLATENFPLTIIEFGIGWERAARGQAQRFKIVPRRWNKFEGRR